MWLETSAPTFMSEGTRIQGSITILSAATIHGVIEGNVVQQSVDLLQVGRTGWIHGSVECQGPLLIEGRVEGDIQCRSGVKLSATAVVTGTILAPTVDISIGAQVNGEFQIRRQNKPSPVHPIAEEGLADLPESA